MAHAIEQYYNYERESHGEAVAIGMYQITQISEEWGLTKPGQAKRIRKVLEAYKLPTAAGIPMGEMRAAMQLDKKNLNDELKIVLLHEIGDAYAYSTDTYFFPKAKMC